MCEGVMYLYQKRLITLYFQHPQAKLPIKRTFGENALITWGRRQNDKGQLPFGGWARLEAINRGMWDPYFPKPVKIPLIKFMQKDMMGSGQWFDITKGYWVQGLVAQQDKERRVYIVTINPELPEAIYDSWPRIIYQ